MLPKLLSLGRGLNNMQGRALGTDLVAQKDNLQLGFLSWEDKEGTAGPMSKEPGQAT